MVLADNGGTTRANTSYDYIGFSLDSYGDDTLEDIQVFLQDREPGDGDLNWKVTNNNWFSNEIAEGTIPQATLNGLGAEGNWVTLGTIPISQDESGNARDRRLWFDNSHSSYYILVKDGVGSYKRAFSSDTWNGATSQTGQLRLRSTRETQTILKAQNTTLKKIYRDSEVMEYLSEKPEGQTATTLFEGLLNQGAKVRRIYSPVTVSVNNKTPPLGKRVAFIDNFNGLHTTPILIGYDIKGYHDDKLEAQSMELELEELV